MSRMRAGRTRGSHVPFRIQPSEAGPVQVVVKRTHCLAIEPDMPKQGKVPRETLAVRAGLGQARFGRSQDITLSRGVVFHHSFRVTTATVTVKIMQIRLGSQPGRMSGSLQLPAMPSRGSATLKDSAAREPV